MTIRRATAADAAAITAIYNHYILNTVVSFEEVPVTETDMCSRLAKITTASLPWLVVEDAGVVIGYAYAGPWKERAAYRYAVEVSVYLAGSHTGQGWGARLYAAVFSVLKTLPVRMVIGGIALPNVASVALHEKFGMRQVAHMHKVGKKFGQWIDVGYWQAELEDGNWT